MKYTAPSDFLPRRAPSGFSAGDPGKSSLEVRCPEVDGLGKGSCVVEPARGGCSPVPDSPTLTYSKIPEDLPLLIVIGVGIFEGWCYFYFLLYIFHTSLDIGKLVL